MKWVAWRQSRLEFIIGLALVAGLAAVLVPEGLRQLSLYRSLGLATMSSTAPGFSTLSQQFLSSYPSWLNDVVNLFGAVLFIFSGLLAVPIVLELEQRTYRLSWTQSVTRRRWLLTKLGFALLSVILISVLYTTLMAWWLGPINHLTGFFNNFTQQGIVPVAYAVFDFSVALAVGAWSGRSSVGVIVAVVVCVAAVTMALPVLSKGLPFNYLQPLQQVSAFTPPTPTPGQSISIRIGEDLPAGSLAVDDYFVDAAGNYIPVKQVLNNGTGSPISQVTEYQPPSRYWAFQGVEAVIFFGASIVLLCGSFWVITHRLR